jgi:hypothetical protein
LHIGIIVGQRPGSRADHAPRRREQAQSGHTHEDSSIPRLPWPSTHGNRPASEHLSKHSVGNIASSPDGKERWAHYASSRSVTREHRHASNSSTSTSTARHHGATDHLAGDLSDGKPCTSYEEE